MRRLSGEKLMTSAPLAWVVVLLRETVDLLKLPCLKLTPCVTYFFISKAIEELPVASKFVFDLELPAPGLKSLTRLPPRFKLPPRAGENSWFRVPPGSLPRVLARYRDALEMAYCVAISASSMNLPFLSVFKYLLLFLAQVSGL